MTAKLTERERESRREIDWMGSPRSMKVRVSWGLWKSESLVGVNVLSELFFDRVEVESGLKIENPSFCVRESRPVLKWDMPCIMPIITPLFVISHPPFIL